MSVLDSPLCTPERVGADLGRAVARLLCRHGPMPCADCCAKARPLTRTVARALFVAAAGHPPRPANKGRHSYPEDVYQRVGAAVGLIEREGVA